jgi:hypothetical protein
MESFDRSRTQVLDWSTRKNADEYRSELLLWPAWGWRVLAPRPRRRDFDIAQKAVLGLVVAGLHREAIARKLHLDPDLVGHLFAEFLGQGLLDPSGKLTESGRQAYQRDQGDPADETVMGWVFADPWDGRLWPLFVDEQLPFAATDVDEEGWQALRGTPGEGRGRRTHTVLPDRQAPPPVQPAALEVLDAIRRQRAQQDHAEPALDAPRVHKVSYITDAPEPFFVVVRCWCNRNGDWFADNPATGRIDRALRHRIEQRRDVDQRLHGYLHRIVAGGGDPERIRNLETKALAYVEDRIRSVHRQVPPEIQRLLVRMQRCIEECALDLPDDRLDNAIVHLQSAFEGLCTLGLQGKTVAAERSAFQLQQGRGMDPEFNRAHLEQIAADLGFSTGDCQLLFRTQAGKIRSSIDGRGGSLRQILCANLLLARRDVGHPLRQLAATHPDLLADLTALSQQRDAASHHGVVSDAHADRWPSRTDALKAGGEVAFDLVRAFCAPA